MKSNFTVKCPYCSKENDFSDDDWRDELIDDSDVSQIDCMHCDYPLEIETNAIYTLKVVNDVIDVSERFDEQSEY